MDAQSRTLAEDTSPEAESLLLERYRGLEVHEKVAIMMDLGRLSDGAALMGIRERHPQADEREQRLGVQADLSKLLERARAEAEAR